MARDRSQLALLLVVFLRRNPSDFTAPLPPIELFFSPATCSYNSVPTAKSHLFCPVRALGTRRWGKHKRGSCVTGHSTLTLETEFLFPSASPNQIPFQRCLCEHVSFSPSFRHRVTAPTKKKKNHEGLGGKNKNPPRLSCLSFFRPCPNSP